MILAELSIKRHVLTYMLAGAIMLFGIISSSRIGVDRFPTIDFPMITVNTVMIGASPEIIDSSITTILESAINTVPGIDMLRSSSSPSVSTIVVRFDMEKDVDVAYSEMQSKINQAINKLPLEAKPPIIAKADIGAAPIMWLALEGDRTIQQLNQYAKTTLKKRLENINGVGEIAIGGERERTIRVELDLKRLANLSLTIQDIMRAFKTQHIQMPGGFLSTVGKEYLIKLDLEYHQIDELKKLIVSYKGNQPIRLEDIATVKDHLADYRTFATYNGKPAVGLGIIKIAGGNTVAIVDNIKLRLEEEILPSLPPGLNIRIASNSATIIEEIVHTLYEHLALGTFLAALVVFVFLKSFRATFIISLAIPVSLLGAVVVMYSFDFTFNMMTLLALLLLIGIVVDDAIVVLENIHRHQEEDGADPVTAAIEGTKEVGFAVLAATFSLVAIFAPVIFMEGIVGRFFVAFAIVVTLGVLVSLFVALTITPMLCSRYLKAESATKHGRIYTVLESGFVAMEKTYSTLLVASLKGRWLVLLVAGAVVLSSGYFVKQLGKEFMPPADEGQLTITFRAPLGSSIDYTVNRLKAIESVLGQHDDSIASYFSAIGSAGKGVNSGSIYVRLKAASERTTTQSELFPILTRELAAIPGVKAFVSRVSVLGGNRGEPLQLILRGPELEKVAELTKVILNKMNAIEGMGNVDTDLQLDLPQLIPILDRNKIASMGISASDVAMAVSVLAGGFNVAKYNDEPGDGERYDIRLKAGSDEINDITDLNNIFLRTSKGDMVRLDTVATFEEKIGPAVIGKSNMQYAAQFYATPTIPVGDAMSILEEETQGLIPLGYSFEPFGQAKEMKKSGKSLGLVLFLSLVLVYMVLASQFNSFSQPLIVMSAQPLAIIGGIVALWLTGHTLNMYSIIGLILLIGLVSKNSILLIDMTNQYREKKGMGVDEALLAACPIRLRPILMTSLSVILTLLPAALGAGAGSDTNGPLAVAVIGGMVSSTLLTLVVVPVVYSLWQGWFVRREQNNAPAENASDS
ncbi:MAG: efflux RND transporter permease subunit [Pseudomonadales bacterium]|nr:efflux RND transporter permease subunit [Pseudomonadales bacterium]